MNARRAELIEMTSKYVIQVKKQFAKIILP